MGYGEFYCLIVHEISLKTFKIMFIIKNITFLFSVNCTDVKVWEMSRKKKNEPFLASTIIIYLETLLHIHLIMKKANVN